MPNRSELSRQKHNSYNTERKGCLKVLLFGGASIYVVASGLYALFYPYLEKENAGNKETHTTPQPPTIIPPKTATVTSESIIEKPSKIEIPGNFVPIREVNGYKVYKETINGELRFGTAFEVNLEKGSQVIPIFADKKNGYFETWSLDQFKSKVPKAEAIVTGSYFGIEPKNSVTNEYNQITETLLNYPQKGLEGPVKGWATDENYKGNWRSLVINNQSAKTVDIPANGAKDFAEQLVDDPKNEIVITGLSPDAKKAANKEAVRTMIATDDEGKKVLVYVGYGTQEQVVKQISSFGVNRNRIIMMDGASSSTIGFTIFDQKLQKDVFFQFVDSPLRNDPMALALIP